MRSLISKGWIQSSVVFIALAGYLNAALGEGPGKWTTRTPMPSSRTEVAVVELGGKIYVIGGFSESGDLVEEFDPGKNSWRRRASLPRPLHHVGAAVVSGKIYVIGGYTSRWGGVDTVYEYDPTSDQWRGRLAASAETGKTVTPTRSTIP